MAQHTVISSGVFFKGVTTDFKSPIQNSQLLYLPGTTVKADRVDLDPDIDCGPGINFCRTLAQALKFAIGGTVVTVTVPDDVVIVDTGGKLRAARVVVGDKADLTSANLTSAYLTDANLTDANLTDANLTSANLRYANLAYANLRYANLTYADLASANLRYANLTYANLTSANLTSADLRYADLTYADLRYANLRYTDLTYADLTSAKGNAYTVLPLGWKVNDAGLIVKV